MSFKSGNNLFYWQDVKCRLTWRHTPQYTPLWSREKLELGGAIRRKQRAMNIRMSQWADSRLSLAHEWSGPILAAWIN